MKLKPFEYVPARVGGLFVLVAAGRVSGSVYTDDDGAIRYFADVAAAMAAIPEANAWAAARWEANVKKLLAVLNEEGGDLGDGTTIAPGAVEDARAPQEQPAAPFDWRVTDLDNVETWAKGPDGERVNVVFFNVDGAGRWSLFDQVGDDYAFEGEFVEGTPPGKAGAESWLCEHGFEPSPWEV